MTTKEERIENIKNLEKVINSEKFDEGEEGKEFYEMLQGTLSEERKELLQQVVEMLKETVDTDGESTSRVFSEQEKNELLKTLLDK
jgi:hypothetical protein